LAEIYQVAL